MTRTSWTLLKTSYRFPPRKKISQSHMYSLVRVKGLTMWTYSFSRNSSEPGVRALYIKDALKASKSSAEKAADFRQQKLYGVKHRRESCECLSRCAWDRFLVEMKEFICQCCFTFLPAQDQRAKKLKRQARFRWPQALLYILVSFVKFVLNPMEI